MSCKKHEFLQKLFYCIVLVNVQFISRSSVVPQETRSLMITVVWCNLLSRCYIPPLDLVSILSVMSKQIPIPIFLTDKSNVIKKLFFNYLGRYWYSDWNCTWFCSSILLNFKTPVDIACMSITSLFDQFISLVGRYLMNRTINFIFRVVARREESFFCPRCVGS